VTMTSIARELPSGRTIDADDFRARMAQHFADAHHHRLRTVSQHELMRGGTPSADAPRTRVTRADAGRSPIGQPDPTPDTASLLAGHGAPV
jgi:hypothetical protein